MSRRISLSFAAEEVLGERLGELRLADAGGADEEEHAERTCRVVELGLDERDDVGDGPDGLVLADRRARRSRRGFRLIARTEASEMNRSGRPVRREKVALTTSAVTSTLGAGARGWRAGPLWRGCAEASSSRRVALPGNAWYARKRRVSSRERVDGVRLDAHFVAALEVARDGVEDAAASPRAWALRPGRR